MTIWDELTPEQNVVFYEAVTEGYLNGLITHYGARLRWEETGSTLNPCNLSEEQVRALIPRFAATVLDMIDRDLIEIREPGDGTWDSAPALTRSEIDAVLADPAAWIVSVREPETNRMVMLMTTDRADRLIGR